MALKAIITCKCIEWMIILKSHLSFFIYSLALYTHQGSIYCFILAVSQTCFCEIWVEHLCWLLLEFVSNRDDGLIVHIFTWTINSRNGVVKSSTNYCSQGWSPCAGWIEHNKDLK